LYIREMLSRRLINRVLIVPPAGLVGNWQREMAKMFNLSFRVIRGGDVRRENPFAHPDSDLVIVSVDTLSSDRVFARLKESATTPYDLVIFDEAHKLASNRDADFTVRRTERYKLAEALIGASSNGMTLDWSARHLLLLTATPHMGREYPYYALWRLLEPEILSTPEAFDAYPPNARQHHFIRRTKEEMVRFDGTPIYPKRVSDTLSYDLTQGAVSEQTLYDQTTEYIRFYYNRARMLNRSAARLAMSVFQRRLASSTYALLQSFERRIKKLEGLIADVEAGRIDLTAFAPTVEYALDTGTADEEDMTSDKRERNEADEETVMRGVVAVSLAELETERLRVQDLLTLAQQVEAQGDESKLQRLLDIIRDPDYRDEKLIVFTEHRDTLNFIVRRLEGMGFTGEIARLHGGMDYPERDQQVELFRKPFSEGGAKYLVATDAAGEGINLQFCWLMVNYDIPWNPARLEQRMGRIHRYGQAHDPVIIMNLVAGKTREGRVLKTLLDKLKKIREELGSDKVFDVVGRLFEGRSIREYMEEVLTASEVEAQRAVDQLLTPEAVQAIEREELALYGEGGDVRSMLPEVNAERQRTETLRLLPGYVRRFIEEAAPLIGVAVEGD
ncbi:MAG: DEAD/DEAH box helicase, partial [Anaerolinea sp.]|nr:DEAD/DEAH box helicase [Anaerolinea sp.]